MQTNPPNLYSGRAGALANVLEFLKGQKEKYVVLADCHLAVNFDFNDLIDTHVESGADITIVYHEQEIPEGFTKVT